MNVDDFFDGYPLSRQIFDHLAAMICEICPAQVRVSKSQVSFRDSKAFAWVWIPARYLRGRVAPLVLTLVFHRRDISPRWKEIVEPSPGNYTHHLELNSIEDVDNQVRGWLQAAWDDSARQDNSEIESGGVRDAKQPDH